MTTAQSFHYLALGDSYTIGEAVQEEGNFPNQLLNLIKVDENFKNSFSDFKAPIIIAKTGWTTDELIEAIIAQKPKGANDLVTLLIGVNNQYRGKEKGYDLTKYKIEFEELLKIAIDLAKNKENVFVISIPDYGVTPFAKELNADKIATELDQYNALAEKICFENKIPFINITLDSKKAATDNSLIAEDGLHPSTKMYQNWANKIFKTINQSN